MAGKLIFLGTGTAAPLDSMRPSAIYFQTEKMEGMIDFGSGSYHRLTRFGIDPKKLNHVFLSHLHSDHVLDFILFLQSNNASFAKRKNTPLHVYGPSGLGSFIQNIHFLFPETIPEDYEIIPHEEPKRLSINNICVIDSCKTGHTNNSIATRFEFNDLNLVYTGDCVISESLSVFSKGADYLITECSFTDTTKEPDHMNPDSVARLASTANPKHLFIVHRYPMTLLEEISKEISQTYHGEISLPFDCEEFSF